MARKRALSNDERVERAEALLGRAFRDRALLLRALTHRSYANEAPQLRGDEHNERLEFLGDAVLGLVAAETLLAHSPSADEGELTRRRAAFVSEPALAKAAFESGLGELVRMGRGQRAGGGALPSLLADVVEALIGAAYLDGGLDVAREVVSRLLGAPPEQDVQVAADPKTELQERLQARFGRVPSYRVSRAGGPDHAPRFLAEAFFNGDKLGEGEGANKKEATRAAALAALAGVALAALEAATPTATPTSASASTSASTSASPPGSADEPARHGAREVER